MSTERMPVRSVTIEFRTVFVTIARDPGLPGYAVSVRHRRADNKQPVTLRPDEAEYVDRVRATLIAGAEPEHTGENLRPLPWRAPKEADA